MRLSYLVVSAWLLLASTMASAQSMVEVPNDPERVALLAAEYARQHPVIPAPVASEPTPPPILVAPPPLKPSHWRVAPRYGLLYLGGSIFSGVYAVNLAVGSEFRYVSALRVPVVGPALEIAKLSHERGFLLPFYFAFALDTAIQAGSVAIALSTLFMREMVWRPIEAR